ncbi:AaceriAGL250Wp [[Ashbya] aceris (nom. inval.)]|nr:AaceriAGL250Wp [[Ashbya] aceris (nom. inval.)]
MSKQLNDSSKDSLDLKTLFVRNIPFDATDAELTDFFSQFAPIKHAVIVKDNEGSSRGFGFVSFAVESDTQAALDKGRKTQFKGRLLRVDVAKRRERSKKGDEAEAQTPPEDARKPGATREGDEGLMRGKPKLIIRNMPWSCRDPTKLKKIFGRFGVVAEASIPRKADGKLCGFAFVTMKKLSNCRKAIEECKGLKIDGREVAVDFAVQKSRWEDYKKSNPESDEEEEAEDAEASDAEGEEEPEEENGSDADERDVADQASDSESEEESDSGDSPAAEADSVRRPHEAPQNRRENYSVFVRNVPYDATQETLEAHFSKFGPVKYALPVQDKETGLPKGTAFVAFKDEATFDACVANAPVVDSKSLLISDDVAPEYVYEGRILAITPTLDRETANRIAEKNAVKRKEALGIAPSERDKRNLYLLNEGRISANSKLAQLLSKTDLEVREKSYAQRTEQLKKNPELHLSMRRLAVRNIPRAMGEAALKILARKAVVEFATEVKEGKRHPLSKEEIARSTRDKYKSMTEEEIEAQKKKDKKRGLVKQAKIIKEVKGSVVGRSKGYGFIEYRDHKAALMGLRWLNAHLVTRDEIIEGMTDEEKKLTDDDGLAKRRLLVEFALDNANVLKTRNERVKRSREFSNNRPDGSREFSNKRPDGSREFSNNRPGGSREFSNKRSDGPREFNRKRSGGYRAEERRKEMPPNKKHKPQDTNEKTHKSGLSDDVKRLIGIKRRRKNGKRS